MKVVLTDHGKILHKAGALHLFPVRGTGANDIAFAAHGELEGRTPIGWNQFFPALERSGRVVVADDEAGTLEIAAAGAIPAQTSDAPQQS
jgi:hypothetical protein